MNTNIYKFIIFFTLLINVGCALPLLENGRDLDELDWQQFPMPITQRYPVLEMSPVSLHNTGNETSTIEHFNCLDSRVSTITDNLPLLDISFIEADINDALLELSLLTNVSIITDDNIDGLVSVNFSAKNLDDALTAIIAPGNYAYKKYDSFIFVGSQSPASTSFHLLSTTCLYQPVFLSALQVVELLSPYYQQYVNYVEGNNHLSIVAPRTIQTRIQSDILIFDQAPEQILLEMSIVEISTRALDLLGIKWNQEVQSDRLFSSENNNQYFYKYSNSVNGASSVIQALVDSLSAINSREEIQIKATPSIVTLNGKEAKFSSTQTVWIPTISNGSNNQQEINYGVELQIIPYISASNQVRLDIKHASVSDLSTGADARPVLISHSISTSVLMLNGETLILGGLLQKKHRDQRQQVPTMSSMPIVGSFFRHKDQSIINTEVLIVIRPKILNGARNGNG